MQTEQGLRRSRGCGEAVSWKSLNVAKRNWGDHFLLEVTYMGLLTRFAPKHSMVTFVYFCL